MKCQNLLGISSYVTSCWFDFMFQIHWGFFSDHWHQVGWIDYCAYTLQNYNITLEPINQWSLGFRDSLWNFLFSRRIFISRTLPSRCQPAVRVWMLMLVFNFKGLQGGFSHFWCLSPKIIEIISPRLIYLLLELALFFFGWAWKLHIVSEVQKNDRYAA